MEISVISVKIIFQNAQKQLKVYDFLLKYLRDTGLMNRIYIYIYIYIHIHTVPSTNIGTLDKYYYYYYNLYFTRKKAH